MTPSIVEPTAPVAPTTATLIRASSTDFGRCTPATSSGMHRVPAEVEGRVQLTTAVSTSSSRTTQEILIGEVEIISMFTPGVAEDRKGSCGHAGVALHPRAHDARPCPCARPTGSSRGRAPPGADGAPRSAASRSSRGTVTDMSARASSDTGSFWMIMSTFTLASASAVSTSAGDAGPVGQPLEGDARLRGGVRHGCDERSFHGLLLVLDHGTGSVIEARSAVDRDPVVARVLHGAELQHARAGRGHLEHLLEGHHRQLAGARARCAGRR